MRNITILHTEASTGWGGQEIRILTELNEMSKKGHRVILACQPDSGILKKADGYGIETWVLPIRGITDLSGIMNLKSVIRDRKIDIVNTHSSKDSWAAGIAAKLDGTAKVVRTRHLSIPVKSGINSQVLYRYLPDAIVTTGESLRHYLINQTRLSPDKIVSIPTGIDLSVFNPDAVNPAVIRREFAINDDTPVIGTVGMIRKMKGHNVFINAVSIIHSYIPDAKFLIVGDTPPGSKESGLKDELIQQIKSLGLENDIFITGYRSDIPAVMASLDVFVLPSIEHEGVPQVISQAMAMGCPVVASNVGAINEQVIPDVTGKLIPPCDPELIAASVIELIKNTEKAKEIGRNGRSLVKRKFNLKGMIESTESLYEMLLNC